MYDLYTYMHPDFLYRIQRVIFIYFVLKSIIRKLKPQNYSRFNVTILSCTNIKCMGIVHKKSCTIENQPLYIRYFKNKELAEIQDASDNIQTISTISDIECGCGFLFVCNKRHAVLHSWEHEACLLSGIKNVRSWKVYL